MIGVKKKNLPNKLNPYLFSRFFFFLEAFTASWVFLKKMLELVLPCIIAGAQNLTIFFFWKTSWIKQMTKHSRSWYPECLFLLSKRKNKNCIVFLNYRVITMENKESLMHSLNSKYIWKSFIKHSEQNKRKCVNVRNDAIWFHGPWTPSLIMCVQTFLIFSQVYCSSYFLISHTRAVLGDQSLSISQKKNGWIGVVLNTLNGTS